MREFRKDVAKVHKRGLTLKPVNKQRPTRHMLGRLRELRDVIIGRAHVIKVPAREAKRQKEIKGQHVIRNRVIIPKKAAKETVRYSKKTKRLTITRTEYGRKETVENIGASNFDELFRFAAANPGHYYALMLPRLGGYERFVFTDIKELRNFLGASAGLDRAADNLAKYVEIITSRKGQRPIEEEE